MFGNAQIFCNIFVINKKTRVYLKYLMKNLKKQMENLRNMNLEVMFIDSKTLMHLLNTFQLLK